MIVRDEDGVCGCLEREMQALQIRRLLSDEYKDWLNNVCCYDPKKRYNCNKLLNHNLNGLH